MNGSGNISRPRRFRTAGFVAAYTAALAGLVAAALTWDGGARVSDAREPVEVASAPPAAVLAEAALAGADAGTGTLTGVITFEGDPPVLPPLAKAGDAGIEPLCMAAGPVPNESLVVNPQNKGIRDVFIYLPKAPAGAKAPEPAQPNVVFDQKNCQYIPHALLIQVGQVVLIKSDDPFLHNTNVFSTVNPGFNQAIPANDRKGVQLTLKKAEKMPIEAKCSIHRFMSARFLVLDHPWMAATDADGKFTIKDIPAGKHEFTLWQEKSGWLNRKLPVEIKPGQTTEVKLSYEAAKFAEP